MTRAPFFCLSSLGPPHLGFLIGPFLEDQLTSYGQQALLVYSDSEKLEHGCGTMYARFASFSGLGSWNVIFQLSGFYCKELHSWALIVWAP